MKYDNPCHIGHWNGFRRCFMKTISVAIYVAICSILNNWTVTMTMVTQLFRHVTNILNVRCPLKEGVRV